jgi:hypothetical protein
MKQILIPEIARKIAAGNSWKTMSQDNEKEEPVRIYRFSIPHYLNQKLVEFDIRLILSHKNNIFVFVKKN